MKKLVLLLVAMVFLAGCVSQPGGQLGNNGLVIQSFAFDVKEIEPEIPITLALSVKNVGAKEVTEAFAELQGPPEWTIKINGKADTLPARQNINTLLPPDPSRGITEGQEDLIQWEMEAPKKDTKITYPFQAVVYYKYVTESESLARVVTKEYYRQSGDRGGLITSKSSAGPLSVSVSMPSSIISDETSRTVPIIVEIQNVGSGTVYAGSEYPTEKTKDTVKIIPNGIACEEKEVRIIDGTGRANCKFTFDKTVSNFQDFPISIRLEYSYYATAQTSVTVLPFEIKDKSKFKNDIITIEDHFANAELSPGDNGRIEFWVKNNGDKDVKNVEVKFFDFPEVQTPSLSCERQVSYPYRGVGLNCIFDKLNPLENRKVKFTFQATEYTKSISFYVNYPYSGSRIFAIPIIDDTILKEPPVKSYISDPTYGQVLVEFDAEGKLVTKDKQTTKEYWGRKGESTQIEIKFSARGSTTNLGPRATVNDIVIPKESVKIKFIGVEEAECEGSKQKATQSIAILESPKAIKPMSSREADNTIKCNIKADVKGLWKIVNVEVTFDYAYQFTNTQQISITKA